MKRPSPPLFLARQSYRRRRLTDAARMLPILGGFLVLLPILWRTDETPEPDTVSGVIYLFSVWTLLIVAALLLSRILSAADAATEPRDAAARTPEAEVEDGPGSS